MAAACARGSTAVRPLGSLGCRRRCEARELVESTLEPPLEQLEGTRASCAFSWEGLLRTPHRGYLLYQPSQSSRTLKSRCPCPLT